MEEFNIDDEVWFIHCNTPTMGTIFAKTEFSTDARGGREFRYNVFQGDCRCGVGWGNREGKIFYEKDNELFSSKEKLIESL